ncbi:GMC family oxidoreductase [Shewanella sp. D64]|uniref:GMC family oxidoreductase n=1 Tax=unclassified Shewanella TaxID=196818 RepID=UPI0022BA3FF1|nr:MULTISPECIES: GMC family oxidoreductase [unclassified Shewanella]MEC4725485.1 GMC family oxidoreductase [Shewanella sp. D64]MEC4738696.1 GMC family oxidoreductase [Shewanella sp. E94]WBJ94992.1 GMC family oxidoreductase [Shewanella sp. MTB7]
MNTLDYDVIVVGSGAGGAMAAYTLTKAGRKVLMLEAGRHYDPKTETPMFKTNFEAPLLGTGNSDKDFGFYDATVEGGWQVPGEPYTKAEGSDFLWWRARMLGGRTNHWGRYSLRFSEHDFKGFSRDGLGADWPFEYQDLAPWYDKTEALVGICGTNTGLDDMPDSSEGILQPPPKPRVTELLVSAAAKKLGIPTAPMHRAVLTRPKDDRQACFYATPCGHGCSIGAAFQTTTSLIPMAKATGRLTVITDAMVKQVNVDEKGTVNAIIYIDKTTKQAHKLDVKVIILAASACESARILLNSKSEHHPQGLANSSGHVGKNIMDSTGVSYGANIPALAGRPRYNEDGHTANHLFIPWWGHKMQAKQELDFPRGYHFEIASGFRAPSSWVSGELDGYGQPLKDIAKKAYGTYVGLALRGEMLPNESCYMEIDEQVKDKWGIPVVKFHWKWSQHELKQVGHGLKTAREILQTMGAKFDNPLPKAEDVIATGGQIIHEVGSTRMGDSPTESVTNQWGQTWDCNNLFVMDAGVFASNPHKNCTLTIMTLAMRNSTWLAQQLNQGAL